MVGGLQLLRPPSVTARRPSSTTIHVDLPRMRPTMTSATSARTPDQTQIGLFWRESSPQQWNRIAWVANHFFEPVR